MTKRFQHQPLFISSSTCLLWGLCLLSLKFSCGENWQWQRSGGGGFSLAGGNGHFSGDGALGGSVGVTQGCWFGQWPTQHTTTHTLTTCAKSPRSFLSSPSLPIFSLLVASFPLSLSLSTPPFFFPALSYLTHTYPPYIQHLEQNNTEHLYYSIGWLLDFFPIYFFSFFLPDSVEWLVCVKLSVTRFPFHPVSSF